MRKIFNFAAREDVFRQGDLTWYLAPYTRPGEVHEKTTTDKKGNTATYRLDYLSNGKDLDFSLSITRGGKTTETVIKAERLEDQKLKVTQFTFDGKKEPLRSYEESFNALNYIVNQIRGMELSGDVPTRHNGLNVPYNTLSRMAIRATCQILRKL